MPDPVAVNSMFARIASRYDLANRLLSGGMDIYWRKRLVTRVMASKPKGILDLATGSGDVAFALVKVPGEGVAITAVDFCQPMLDEAERKKKSVDAGKRIHFQQADILNLPFPDARFDAATLSFGLRNLVNRDRGLKEIRRVLRPGGTLIVLEFSQPYRWFRPLYYFYLNRVLPVVAGWLTGDRAAYEYLNNTITSFPDRDTLSREFLAAGFASVTAAPMTLGIVALHTVQR